MDPLERDQNLSNPTAGKYVAGSAWHCYTATPASCQDYNTLHQRFPTRKSFVPNMVAGAGTGAAGGVMWTGHGPQLDGRSEELVSGECGVEPCAQRQVRPTPRPDSEARDWW